MRKQKQSLLGSNKSLAQETDNVPEKSRPLVGRKKSAKDKLKNILSALWKLWHLAVPLYLLLFIVGNLGVVLFFTHLGSISAASNLMKLVGPLPTLVLGVINIPDLFKGFVDLGKYWLHPIDTKTQKPIQKKLSQQFITGLLLHFGPILISLASITASACVIAYKFAPAFTALNLVVPILMPIMLAGSALLSFKKSYDLHYQYINEPDPVKKNDLKIEFQNALVTAACLVVCCIGLTAAATLSILIPAIPALVVVIATSIAIGALAFAIGFSLINKIRGKITSKSIAAVNPKSANVSDEPIEHEQPKVSPKIVPEPEPNSAAQNAVQNQAKQNAHTNPQPPATQPSPPSSPSFSRTLSPTTIQQSQPIIGQTSNTATMQQELSGGAPSPRDLIEKQRTEASKVFYKLLTAAKEQVIEELKEQVLMGNIKLPFDEIVKQIEIITGDKTKVEMREQMFIESYTRVSPNERAKLLSAGDDKIKRIILNTIDRHIQAMQQISPQEKHEKVLIDQGETEKELF